MKKEWEQRQGILAEMTSEEVCSLNPEVVVLPLGSTEPHGPHLPFGTDTFITEEWARQAVLRANAGQARTLLYPTLPITNNVNFQGLPFACRIGVSTLMQVVLDIVAALEQDGVRKIVLLNWHGGNGDTLQATLRQHMGQHRPGEGAFVCLAQLGTFVSSATWNTIEHPSPHAGESETSMMLHLRPELVAREHLGTFPQTSPTLEALARNRVFYVRPWHALLPAGAGGDTRASTAAKGSTIMEEAIDNLAQFLRDLSAASWSADFPFAPPQDGPATTREGQ